MEIKTSDKEDLAIPAWVVPVLEKMKVEMCAEITARVAYSVRIMLDKNLKEMKELFQHEDLDEETGCDNIAFCHDCFKKQMKKQENSMKKEERKAKKEDKKAKKIEKRCNRAKASLSKEQKREPDEAQNLFCEQKDEEKPLSPAVDLKPLELKQQTSTENILSPEKEILSCESEFEVVPMPTQEELQYRAAGNYLDSTLNFSEDGTDVDESLDTRQNEETGAVADVTWCSLTSSVSSTTTVKPHEEKPEENAADNIVPEQKDEDEVSLERERSPYATLAGEITVLNMVEDVGDEANPQPDQQNVEEDESVPLIQERQRTPYSSSASAEDTRRPAGSNHVDILPENLWKGAVSVAAQAYNAAKSVVGSAVVGNQSPARSPAPRDQRSDPPGPMEQLISMGFTNRVLNSHLLARFHNNIDQVVNALLEY